MRRRRKGDIQSDDANRLFRMSEKEERLGFKKRGIDGLEIYNGCGVLVQGTGGMEWDK
jgi:hypothetical protein